MDYIKLIMITVYESLKQGLTEACEFAQGKTDKAVAHKIVPVDVKAIRKKAVPFYILSSYVGGLT